MCLTVAAWLLCLLAVMRQFLVGDVIGVLQVHHHLLVHQKRLEK
jgi:hypothetical protein